MPRAHEVQLLGIRARLVGMRALGVGMLALVLLSASQWSVAGPALVGDALFAVGLLLVVLAFLGRLWTRCYIGGRKKRILVTTGPYELCRHPLYLFSLLGGFGLGLCTERLAIAALALGAGLLSLPGSIRREESFLAARFAAYQEYRRRVPVLLPRWPLRSSVEEVHLGGRELRRIVLEAAAFLAAPALLALVAGLQASGLFPHLFLLP